MNSRKTTIWFLACLLLLFAAVAVFVTWPFLRAIASAVIVAVIFYPAFEHVLRWSGGRRGWASLFTTLGIVVVFLVPVAFILLKATSEAIAVAQHLNRLSAEQGGFTLFVAAMLERPLHFIARFVDVSRIDVHQMVTSNVQRVSLAVLSSGAVVLGNLARFTASFFLMLVVVFFLFRDGEQWAETLASMMPLSPAQSARLFHNITDTIIGNVYGIVSVGVAQGLLTGIAVTIVGLPSPLLLGLGAFFASIIPVVGAALIWVPAGLFLIFKGALWKGLFVLIWGTVVISMADNVIRPWVVSGKIELHPLVLLFFILGGVEAFGFLGLFLGPVIASVLFAVLDLLRDEIAVSSANPAVVASEPSSLSEPSSVHAAGSS
jgi:predicted PurR-regulated permease PerM